MKLFPTAALASLMLCATATALAETVPEQMPFDIPYGAPIDLQTAKKIADAAQAEAHKHQWKEVIVIVDTHGSVVYFAHMDQAQLASNEVALEKARSASSFRRPTEVFEKGLNSGGLQVASLPGAMPVEGGFPILIDGKMVGAIGASGGTGSQDVVVATAGLNALK